MGYSNYSVENRSSSDRHVFYNTASTHINDIFLQNKERKAHESMLPKNALMREARDSEAHPLSFPVILALDETGSMLSVPEMFIKEGMPTLMSKIQQAGTDDPALLFLGIGDHECDHFPLQVGQFESGDEQIDMWLTRVFLEGNGGGNRGESYMLPWYYAAYHTATDAWEKRKIKGVLITIGDEPVLSGISGRSLKELMGEGQFADFYKSEELLKIAQLEWNVYHIHIAETGAGQRLATVEGWKELLGQNLIVAESYTELPKIISELIVNNSTSLNFSHKASSAKIDNEAPEPTQEVL
jgi:hypothetical protein